MAAANPLRFQSFLTPDVKRMKKTILLLASTLLASCTAQPLIKDAETVRVMLTHKPAAECTYLGEVIGSQGHWYDFLFTPNTTLVQGAINDMKNQTLALGGNTLYISQEMGFVTSQTLLGQAFRCPLTVKPNPGGVIF